MMKLKKLNLGIVGACRRGASFRNACDALENVNIQAVCDINAEDLPAAAERLGATEQYTDYDEMLAKSDIDGVIIGTPMQFHAAQSIAALKLNKHVLCEVTAAVSMQECRDLVKAWRASEGVYMMAENCNYMKPNVMVKALVDAGLFGDVYYAEGEYLHELKELNEKTPWRRKWQTGVEGITYCTHSLGPILQWMPGDRVVRVCCEGSGRHYTDPRGEKYHQESPVMLCKTANGALIKIRVDMISDRPDAPLNYQLQGTDGCYESGRNGLADRGKIWLRTLNDVPNWVDADSLWNIRSFAEKFLPKSWRKPPEAASKSGHGGSDYFEVLDWVNAICGNGPCPVGIHEALDMTLPGLISQQSILEEGRWIDVPDSRTW